MLRIFAALIDAARFTRSYQRLARITDDATRTRPHDTQETLQQAWAEVERACSHTASHQRDINDGAPRGGSPSLHVALKAAPAETDFPA